MKVPVALSIVLLAASCANPEVVAIELLPPRTSALCSAPTPNSSASGEGLLDLDATDELHGAYIGDLRITGRGEAVVSALKITADGSTETLDIGDVFLPFDDTDAVSALVENVEIISRDLAIDLESGSEATDVVFERLNLEITAVDPNGVELNAAASTLAINLCKGCLVAEPDEDECPDGFGEANVCRPGQDVPLFECSAPAAAPPGPPVP